MTTYFLTKKINSNLNVRFSVPNAVDTSELETGKNIELTLYKEIDAFIYFEERWLKWFAISFSRTNDLTNLIPEKVSCTTLVNVDNFFCTILLLKLIL